MPIRLRLGAGALVALAAFGSEPASATPHNWPDAASAHCATTLQTCIDNTIASDTVSVNPGSGASDVVQIDEDITINHSLTLNAAPGIDAVFAKGRNITVTSPSATTMNLTIDGLAMSYGSIVVTHASSASSHYTIGHMHMRQVTSPGVACAISFTATGSGLATVTLQDNSVQLRGPTVSLATGLCLNGSSSAPWTANILRNRVRITDNVFARGVVIGASGVGGAQIAANQVIGDGFGIAYDIEQTAGSSAQSYVLIDNVADGANDAHSFLATGFNIVLDNATVYLTNNTAANDYIGVSVEKSGSSSTISGRLANNLVAFNSLYGIYLQPGTEPSVSNAHNLVYGNGGNIYSPGTGTIISNPMLVDVHAPRLTLLSPAIDTGSNAEGPGTLDADLESRIVNGTVDIGAYEFSLDVAGIHTATATNTTGAITAIDEFGEFGLSTGDRLIVTPIHDAALGPIAKNLGVFTNTACEFGFGWCIYNEDMTALQVGRRYSVLAPRSHYTTFVRTTDAGDTSDSALLDNASLNNQANAVPFVTHNYNPAGGSGAAWNSQLALIYSVGDLKWRLWNDNFGFTALNFVPGISFNVAVPALGSPNAFVAAPVGSAGPPTLKLQHPLLDDNDCAAPQLARDNVDTFFDVNPASLGYVPRSDGVPGHWFIVVENPGGYIPPGATGFHVLVNGTQAGACLDDRIFADWFEN